MGPRGWCGRGAGLVGGDSRCGGWEGVAHSSPALHCPRGVVPQKSAVVGHFAHHHQLAFSRHLGENDCHCLSIREVAPMSRAGEVHRRRPQFGGKHPVHQVVGREEVKWDVLHMQTDRCTESGASSHAYFPEQCTHPLTRGLGRLSVVQFRLESGTTRRGGFLTRIIHPFPRSVQSWVISIMGFWLILYGRGLAYINISCQGSPSCAAARRGCGAGAGPEGVAAQGDVSPKWKVYFEVLRFVFSSIAVEVPQVKVCVDIRIMVEPCLKEACQAGG